MSVQDPHRFERGRDVAGSAEIVAVQMERMRQLQVVDDFRQAGDDLRRRQRAVAFDGAGHGLGVLAPFPCGDASGVHRLHAVGLGGPDQPGDDVLRPLELARLEEIQHDFVVGHQHETRLVDDRRVVQLFVRVPGGKDRHRRFVDGRPAHARVQVAGRERRGRDAAQTGATLGRVHERKRAPHVFRRQARARSSARRRRRGCECRRRQATPPGRSHQSTARLRRRTRCGRRRCRCP